MNETGIKIVRPEGMSDAEWKKYRSREYQRVYMRKHNDNPERRKANAERTKKWQQDNPERAKELARKVSQSEKHKQFRLKYQRTEKYREMERLYRQRPEVKERLAAAARLRHQEKKQQQLQGEQQ